ncbi:uncharacterized protein LOC135137297 [Zophobas morio]|uniref:uncharacterized protein LOC135137297 n=1 Tax=Zophobas morio TaxID=2755281 RepID=UPI003083892E
MVWRGGSQIPENFMDLFSKRIIPPTYYESDANGERWILPEKNSLTMRSFDSEDTESPIPIFQDVVKIIKYVTTSTSLTEALKNLFVDLINPILRMLGMAPTSWSKIGDTLIRHVLNFFQNSALSSLVKLPSALLSNRIFGESDEDFSDGSNAWSMPQFFGDYSWNK